jgi:transposase
MPDDMTGTYDRVEVITSVQRRRRWTPEEKIRIVEETYLPGQLGVVGRTLPRYRG